MTNCFDEIEKGKVYLQPGQNPPTGKQVMTGAKGGRYYESGGSGQVEESKPTTPKMERRAHPKERVRLVIEGEEPKEVDVKDEYKDGVEPGKDYRGKCFDRAGLYVVWNPNENIKLVHGTVEFLPGMPLEFAHAWAELPGNIVFDGIVQRFYDKTDYYQKMHAVKEREYTSQDAMKMMLKKGTYGPWHNTNGMLKD